MSTPEKQASARFVREKRKLLGLSQRALALMLGLNDNGERTVRGWEAAELVLTEKNRSRIDALQFEPTYALDDSVSDSYYRFSFIDLFAGIGGIRLAFQNQRGRCVFSSEWDKFAQKTYTRNFGDMPFGDITRIPAAEIEDHDVLLGGFPCQAFSQAGLKKGFNDTRGTLFFEIQRILAVKRPKAFMLENVKQLKGHDKGRTLKTIIDILSGNTENGDSLQSLPVKEDIRQVLSKKLNYWVDFRILNARDFGVPQNRERIYIVGFDRDSFPAKTRFDELFHWPEETGKEITLGDILEADDKVDDKYTISEKLWAGHKRRREEHAKKGNGFGYCLFNRSSIYTSTISARYYKDGSEILIDQSHISKRPRKLTPRECARLQGFPEDYDTSAVSDGQMYKQFGNSVAVPVVSAIAENMVNVLAVSKKDKARKSRRQQKLRFYASME